LFFISIFASNCILNAKYVTITAAIAMKGFIMLIMVAIRSALLGKKYRNFVPVMMTGDSREKNNRTIRTIIHHVYFLGKFVLLLFFFILLIWEVSK
jgi:hypothetical protein